MEIDFDDKVMLLQARNDACPYAIFVLHKAAPRQHRKEMLSLVKKVPELEGSDIDAAAQQIEDLAEDFESKWIKLNCDEDNLPLFDFDINLNENE